LPEDLGTRPAGEDWPSFLGARRDGKSQETGLAVPAPQAPPIRWQAPLGESHGAPSIARGRLFHFDRFGAVNRLTCRRSETGEVLWTYEYPATYEDRTGGTSGPRSTPVVDGARAYVVGAEGELHCVRAADGARLWSIDTTARFGVVKNFFGVGSTPVVWNDLLLVHVGGSPAGSPPDIFATRGAVRGNGTCLVALDKYTGAVRWQAADDLASYSSPIVAEIEGEPLCLVLARGGLAGVRAGNGEVAFTHAHRARNFESVNVSTPVAAGDEVFVSEAYGPGGALVRLRGGTCTTVWTDAERGRRQALPLYLNTPIRHEGFLYGSSGQHSGQAELRCVAWSTGEVQWSQPDWGRASLLYVDGRLLVLSEDGVLRWLRATPQAATQEAQWRLVDAAGEPLLNYPAWTAPVCARGLLYVRGKDRLVCLDLAQP